MDSRIRMGMIIGFLFFSLLHPSVFAGGPDTGFEEQRKKLAYNHLHDKGIENTKVLDAIYAVKRHLFLPRALWSKAYEDIPLPLDNGYFIPEPSLAALIADRLLLGGEERVLVIGTHEGYLCAVLSRLAKAVFTVEKNYADFKLAAAAFSAQGLGNIRMRLTSRYFDPYGDMRFDRIVINGCVSEIPPDLVSLLDENGILIAPVGDPAGFQKLIRITKKDNKTEKRVLATVMFPPLE
jgi:protein-L-isoaspartate(D-aspartate) O-methyltransferase